MAHDILSGSIRDSPVIWIPIEEEADNIPLGSSLITRKKRGANRPKSPMQKKRNIRTSRRVKAEAGEKDGSSITGDEISMELNWVTTVDIPRFFLPFNPNSKQPKLTKN